MSFDLSWFTSLSGMLLTGGVLLLVIALIMLLVSQKKAKKAREISLIFLKEIPLLCIDLRKWWMNMVHFL